jgi:hypothetical protein
MWLKCLGKNETGSRQYLAGLLSLLSLALGTLGRMHRCTNQTNPTFKEGKVSVANTCKIKKQCGF